ncbi:ribonuclease III domain-containing protein [Mrakia frigida]|uniref:ribonuclease III domain-containing protein n=1 Tax=Mrakia frigida TaxID=29902 RepID=UPI003FCC150D
MATSTPEYELFLSQLKPSDLPPLPDLPLKLRRLAATHPSYAGGNKTEPFETSEESGTASMASYKTFEFVGDTIIQLASTLLIKATHPRLSCGAMTDIRKDLVSNNTLSHLSRLYLLPATLLAHPAQLHLLRSSNLVQAQMMEAYIGALETHHEGHEVALEFCREMFKPLLEVSYLNRKVVQLQASLVKLGVSGAAGGEGGGESVGGGPADVSILEEWSKKKGKLGRVVRYERGESSGASNAPRHEGTLVVEAPGMEPLLVGPILGAAGERWKTVQYRLAHQANLELKLVPPP